MNDRMRHLLEIEEERELLRRARRISRELKKRLEELHSASRHSESHGAPDTSALTEDRPDQFQECACD
jgi:hypothetical protein